MDGWPLGNDGIFEKPSSNLNLQTNKQIKKEFLKESLNICLKNQGLAVASDLDDLSSEYVHSSIYPAMGKPHESNKEFPLYKCCIFNLLFASFFILMKN